MNKREFLGQLGLVAMGATLALVCGDLVFDRDADRRFALYNIMRQLKKGMSHYEVEVVINRHDAPFIEKISDENSISLYVWLGGVSVLYLTIVFSNGVLETARFAGEDNEWDAPNDAPQSIM